MTTSFDYFIPTKLLFGPGKLNSLATIKLPGSKALIVISNGTAMKTTGTLDRVCSLLSENNTEYSIFAKVQPNPIKQTIMDGAQQAKDENCDFIIGLGGGSSIDSAKSIAIMASNEGDYWDYVSGGSGLEKAIPNAPLPIVAITTTAGTGTEIDPWTVITKEETKEKIGFGNDQTFPVLSIVDPELMVSVPARLTAFQGFDALFHATEGFIANIATPISDIYAKESIRLVAQNLPTVVADGTNIEARSAIALANTLSGMVESTSCCVSMHSMEHALSAWYPKLPHGAGLITLSVAYYQFFASKIPGRIAEMAPLMGVDTQGMNEQQQADAFVEALKKLIDQCGLKELSMSDYDIKEEDIPAIVANARSTMGALFELDRYSLSDEETIQIIEQSWNNN